MSYRDPSEIPCSSDGRGCGCFEQPCRRTARGAAENMIGESRNFQEGVDGGEKSNKEDREPREQLDGRKSARRREAQSAEDQIPNHIDHTRCDNLVEGILDKAAKPAPEKPLHFWNDEEWNKDRANQHTDRGGDKAVGDDDQRDCLGRRKQNDHDHINRSAKKISPTG